MPEVRLACPSARIVLCGAKSDLRASDNYVSALAARGHKVVSPADAADVADSLGVAGFVCSALSRRGLKAVFDHSVSISIAPPAPPPPPASPRALRAAAMVAVRCALEKGHTLLRRARRLRRPRARPVLRVF